MNKKLKKTYKKYKKNEELVEITKILKPQDQGRFQNFYLGLSNYSFIMFNLGLYF